jgi:hypothetical protein
MSLTETGEMTMRDEIHELDGADLEAVTGGTLADVAKDIAASLKASSTKGGGAFEIKDFSFGVENPTTIGS